MSIYVTQWQRETTKQWSEAHAFSTTDASTNPLCGLQVPDDAHVWVYPPDERVTCEACSHALVPKFKVDPSLPEMQPFRNLQGEVVTITLDQVYAIWKAFDIWRRVYEAELGHAPDLNNPANWMKSCLLWRLLGEGKPPTAARPPLDHSVPQWHLVEVEA